MDLLCKRYEEIEHAWDRMNRYADALTFLKKHFLAFPDTACITALVLNAHC